MSFEDKELYYSDAIFGLENQVARLRAQMDSLRAERDRLSLLQDSSELKIFWRNGKMYSYKILAQIEDFEVEFPNADEYEVNMYVTMHGHRVWYPTVYVVDDNIQLPDGLSPEMDKKIREKLSSYGGGD